MKGYLLAGAGAMEMRWYKACSRRGDAGFQVCRNMTQDHTHVGVTKPKADSFGRNFPLHPPSQWGLDPFESDGQRNPNWFVREIMERKRVEDSLRETELRYRTFFGHSPLGVLTIDLGSGTALEFNDIAARQLGYSREEFAALSVLDYEVKENKEQFEARIQRILKQGNEQFKTRHRKKTGEVRDVLVTARAMELGGKKLANCVYQDITEWTRAHQLIHVQSAALKAAANGIVITTSNGTIEWVNDAFTRMTGYSFEEAVGQNPRVLKSGRHSARFYREMWNSILAGKVWRGEVENQRKDGSVYYEEMTITPVCGDDAKISHFIAIKHDITERKQAEKHTLRAQRLESLGTLAGGIAHDLNNALAPILMSIEWLALENPAGHEVYGLLHTSARRAADMVQQLVTFAKGADGERLAVQTRHLAKEIAKIAVSTFPKNIKVVCHAPSDLPTVLGDATQLHQVLLNLTVNARDAMPSGGTLTIEAARAEVDATFASTAPEAKPGHYLVLSVADTGVGIPPKVLERIFDPFFSTKPADKGTGLGLSTATGIVRSHGGFIRVQSVPGQGSRFAVYLPANQTESATVEQAGRGLTDYRGNGEWLLVVDDEFAVRNIMRPVLERLNFQVLTAGEGADGLIIAAEHREEIKVVITDLQMPNMDGITFAKVIRRMLPQAAIIISTGRLDPAQTEQLQALGVKGLLQKPFSEGQLREVLRAALNSGGETFRTEAEHKKHG